MNPVAYRTEPFSDVYPDINALLTKHYDEIAEEQDLFKLNPDLDMYRLLDAKGHLHILTARIDGKLIGYFIGLVHPHLHYKDVVVGNDDIYFVDKDYRHSNVGHHLVKYMLEVFKKKGCKAVTIKTKVAHDNSALLTGLGMRPFEKTFLMRMT